jgi:hypothetical protein
MCTLNCEIGGVRHGYVMCVAVGAQRFGGDKKSWREKMGKPETGQR